MGVNAQLASLRSRLAYIRSVGLCSRPTGYRIG